MSSGFTGGGPDFYATGGIAGRSIAINNPQGSYRSQLAGIGLVDPSSQIAQRRSDMIGKRTLAEFQTHHQQKQQQQQQQQQQHNLLNPHQQQQQQHGLGLYLRSVKPRIYQNSSPISPLSPVDFSGTLLPEVPFVSSSSATLAGRYGLPIIQNLRTQQMNQLGNGMIPPCKNNTNLSPVSYPNLVQNRVMGEPESEKKMRNRLQELEKQLLDDNEDDEQQGDDVSVITGSEWSETIQNLINPNQKPPISPSPTSSSSPSSSSSSSSSIVSPISPCSKQSLMEAASAISEGKNDIAAEIINRLAQSSSNPGGNSEQRLTAYMAGALKSRLSPTTNPPPVVELYGNEQMGSLQLLYEHSFCFKLGFTAANLAILEATSEASAFHIVDFDIGHGGQYYNLLHLLSLHNKPAIVKITAVEDLGNGGEEERLRVIREKLSQLSKRAGICVEFNVVSQMNICELSRESLGCDSGDEVLVVNLAFKLYKMADESVTTDNPRDELLRQVKKLRPRVVTVVEQEMNCNTAPFVARVGECCSYYGALLESLDAAGNNSAERVRIEEGLSRKLANSVACEGRDRVERCEVFGKWRARMGMAGFELKPLSQHVNESLRTRVNSVGTRGNPGFTLKEENGGACFGWMGRTLTVASTWR